MKFSEAWLRELVNPDINRDELVAQLTMAGLEVDGVEAAARFSGVVVARIVELEPHPDARKLRVCRVDDGSGEYLQVVCGAPNARTGLVTALARVGAHLSGGDKIEAAELRGVSSSGMLCSGAELGLGDDDSGLLELPDDAQCGISLYDYYGLNDHIIEVDLTPNRGDCLSIVGLAREVGALNEQAVKQPDLSPVSATVEATFPVSLDTAACPCYTGRVIKNIDISRPTPTWMQERLRRSGIRSIDAVVDITNYVMLELGQPMHAFDLHRLNGIISVRSARGGEKLTLLDGREVELDTETTVIADQKSPLAMAGIMGGVDSGVSGDTTDLFLESAHFDPMAIAGKARQYGLHTDSSHRFERGVDPLLTVVAIERATQLLLEYVGGEAGPVLTHGKARPPQELPITLRKTRVKQQLGLDLDDAVILSMMERLGVGCETVRAGEWRCSPPSWRFDLEIEADLIEEIARLYGYNRLPSTTVPIAAEIQAKEETRNELADMESLLVNRGYHQAITYSFIDPELSALLDPGVSPIAVANPISADMGVMRTSLLPGLLKTVEHNLKRQQNRIRVFESGLRFRREGEELVQDKMLAGVICGPRHSEGWANDSRGVDFFDVKGDVEALLAVCGITEKLSWVKSEWSAMHPGQSLALAEPNGSIVGHLGKLHPALVKTLGFSQAVYQFELNYSAFAQGVLPVYEEVGRFPIVRRDIALLVDSETAIGTLIDTVKSVAGQRLSDLKVFDVYQGEHLENNRKSVAFGLTFHDNSRTLTDEEVSGTLDTVVRELESRHGAALRG